MMTAISGEYSLGETLAAVTDIETVGSEMGGLDQLLDGITLVGGDFDESDSDPVVLVDPPAASELVIEPELAPLSLESQLGQLAIDQAFLHWVDQKLRGLGQYQVDAHDIVQATLARMVGRDISPGSVKAYAYRVATTRLADLARRQIVARGVLGHRVDAADMCDVADHSVADTFDRVEWALSLSPVIKAVIQALPTRERQAVLLRHYEGLDLNTTAAVMGVAPGTVKSATSRGLIKLHAALTEPAEATR